MDTSKFTAESPGQIVTIPNPDVEGGQINTFLPDELPPKWSFPTQLWPLLSDAKSEIGVLEGIGRTLPNPGILLRPLADREALRSSRLEGTYATARELLLYEMAPDQEGELDESRGREREVFNYRRALNQGMTSNLPLSLRLITEPTGVPYLPSHSVYDCVQELALRWFSPPSLL